jgi:hypothetical protein
MALLAIVSRDLSAMTRSQAAAGLAKSIHPTMRIINELQAIDATEKNEIAKCFLDIRCASKRMPAVWTRMNQTRSQFAGARPEAFCSRRP